MEAEGTVADGFGPVEVEVSDLGIPSIIKIVAPEMPDIRIIHDVPQVIKIEEPKIPSVIKILAPDFAIPDKIKVINAGVPETIELVADKVPTAITLDVSGLPEAIKLEVPENFPASIKLDASEIPDKIQVVGIPPAIELIGNIPTAIQLVMPEKPEVELVYKGAPIDVKIQLDVSRLTGDDQHAQCVAIVPCKPAN